MCNYLKIEIWDGFSKMALATFWGKKKLT